MTHTDSIDSTYRAGTGPGTVEPSHRPSTETKPATKTTEFFVFLTAVAAVVITALVVGQDDSTGIDPFSALDAVQYITFLSIGYIVARGLAKSGSRERHTH
jgi:hypothetical protein